MTRLPSRTRSGLQAAVSLLAVAALVASCGSGHSAAGDSSATKTSSQAAVVLAAYRAEQAAFEQAVDSANPNLPALARTMTGAQLDSVRRALVTDQVDGIVGRGTVRLSPKVSYVHSTQALVLDCAFDSSELVYAATGKPVPPVTPPSKVAIRSQLTEVTPGVWKVADQATTNRSCPAGY